VGWLSLRATRINSCTSHSLASAAAMTPVRAWPMRSTWLPESRNTRSFSSPSVSDASDAKTSAVDVVIDAHHAVDAPLVVGQRMFVKVLER